MQTQHVPTRTTFSLVTDEAVHGSFGSLVLKADKLPALRHGMEQWELKFIYENKLIHHHVVKCTPGKGAEEARDIISEEAPYWSRRAWERSQAAPVVGSNRDTTFAATQKGECHACGENNKLNKHGACRSCEIDAHNEAL